MSDASGGPPTPDDPGAEPPASPPPPRPSQPQPPWSDEQQARPRRLEHPWELEPPRPTGDRLPSADGPGRAGQPPPPGRPEPLGRPDANQLHWAWPVAVLSLALLLLVTSAGGALMVLGQQRQVRALERDLERTRAELEATRQELATERGEELPQPQDDGGGLGGLLDQLLEGLGGAEGLGGLEGLLEGLPDGGDAMTRCLVEAMAPPEGGVRTIPRAGAEEQVAAIAERVEELRGLTFPEEVDTRFVGADDFAAEVRQAFEEDYAPEEAAVDQRMLATLGAIPADMDLRERYLDLVAGQAAGFYDPDTREIVVRADPGAPLSASEQVILAHELEHALSDARLGLPDLDTDDDAARAALALVEGGATLAMQQFAGRAIGPAGQLGMALDPGATQAQAQLAAFPHHLQRELLFPYENGLVFACHLHTAGGWAAIDDAYAAPPTSTAEVLWPERHDAGEEPTAPQPFAEVPEGFTEVRATTFGAAELLWLFEAPGADPEAALPDPMEAAAAWDGGTLRVLSQEDETALGIALVQRPGEADLCGNVADWYRAAFPRDRVGTPEEGERLVVDGAAQDAVLICADGEVRLGIAPDTATARSVAR